MQGADWAEADAIAAAVLRDHGGVARIGAFLAAGLSRHQVAAIFRRGVIERPRNAWFVDPELPWRAKCAVRVGGVLGCASAAAELGLPIPPDAAGRIHVVVAPDASHLRHSRDQRHEVVAGEDLEVDVHWVATEDPVRGWSVSPLDALLQLFGCVTEEWFVAAMDAALHRPFAGGEPLLSSGEFEQLTRLLPRRARRALGLVDARSDSCLETLLRLGLLRRGLGPLQLQFSPDGRQRVDLLVGDRLIIEADGAAFHDPEADRNRDAAFRALGYTVLRFTYDDIVLHLEDVLDRIAAALASC